MIQRLESGRVPGVWVLCPVKQQARNTVFVFAHSPIVAVNLSSSAVMISSLAYSRLSITFRVRLPLTITHPTAQQPRVDFCTGRCVKLTQSHSDQSQCLLKQALLAMVSLTPSFFTRASSVPNSLYLRPTTACYNSYSGSLHIKSEFVFLF